MTPAWEEGIFFISLFCRYVYRCLPCVALQCVAECNCGCVLQFASVSSCRGSGVQLEEHRLCSGVQLQQHWLCSGVQLQQHWLCSVVQLQQHWLCSGVQLQQHWLCSVVQLQQHWLCSRTDEQHNTESWNEHRALIWVLNTENNVFCFKFVFLCFSKQYHHFNITYIDGRKIIFSFRMLLKPDAAYLEFQKHISWYSNTQCTVHITRWQFLLSAPTQNTAVLLCFRRTQSR